MPEGWSEASRGAATTDTATASLPQYTGKHRAADWTSGKNGWNALQGRHQPT